MKEMPSESLTPKERGILYQKGEEVDHIPYSLISTETAAVLYGIDIRKTYTDVEVVIELEKKDDGRFRNRLYAGRTKVKGNCRSAGIKNEISGK